MEVYFSVPKRIINVINKEIFSEKFQTSAEL